MARIIVAGYMVRNPIGGSLWADLQYVLGLRRLKHDAYFFEEFGWPNSCYDYANDRISDDATWGAHVIRRLMRRFDLNHRWVYRDADGKYHGLSANRMHEIISSADLLLNLSGATWFDEFERIPYRMFVDRDPGFTQFGCANDAKILQRLTRRHTHFSIFAVRIGQTGCPVPTLGLRWHPTRQPVVLSEWPMQFDPHAKTFTTVMTWDAYGSIRYQGQVYGPKGTEFLKIIKLPSRTSQPLEVAVGEALHKKIAAHGWHVNNSVVVSRTPETYRDYIQKSRGEFSIAKHCYVKTRSGWFSDRSAVYLATGKPVVVQETGFSDWLPLGEGLLAFSNEDEALAALERVNGDYRRHCEAARAIALEFFDSDRVLRDLLSAWQ